MTERRPAKRGILDWIELVGNKLPEPVLLFAMLAILAIFVSGIGAAYKWKVQPVRPVLMMEPVLDAAGSPVLDAEGKPKQQPRRRENGRPVVKLESKGDPIAVQSLMTKDGIYWMLSSMIRNFINFPPLGLVITGMLGIGVAEKVGLFGVLMRWLASVTPKRLLTPVIVFIGANSSIASDAGYIILPPLAAALFYTMGRHPLAGLSASFAGVAGGVGAGAFITGADTVLAGVATSAAQVLDPAQNVLATANWYFKAASAPIIALLGWFVTDRIVEPRLIRAGVPIPPDAAPAQNASAKLSSIEITGLLWAGITMTVTLGIFALFIWLDGWPLYGRGQPTLPNGTPAPGEREGPRWSQVIVPMMFFAFLAPGAVYGIVTRAIKNQADFVGAMYHAIRGIAPVIVMNFFAAQFIAYFSYTNLDRLLAFSGGRLLVEADLPVPLLLVVFIALIILADFALSSMTAKFTLLAPIVIPMFMMVGVSPALTTGAYRIGDSVVNIVTPLNSYLAIVLLVLQRYQAKAGLGSLIALMVPYSVVFGVLWTAFLLVWYLAGFAMGPGGGLHYVPPAQ